MHRTQLKGTLTGLCPHPPTASTAGVPSPLPPSGEGLCVFSPRPLAADARRAGRPRSSRSGRKHAPPHPRRPRHRLRQAGRHRQFDRPGARRERHCRRRLRPASRPASPTNSTRPKTPGRELGRGSPTRWSRSIRKAGGTASAVLGNVSSREADANRMVAEVIEALRAGSTSSSTTPARPKAPTATRSRTCRSRRGI